MLEALKSVRGVKSVTSLGRKEDGTFDFLIEPNRGIDIRPAVFDRIVSRGKTLLSFTSNSASLEQIFLRLTEVEDNDEARRLLGFNSEKEDVAETDTEADIETETDAEKEEN